MYNTSEVPVPVAAPSKASVYGNSPAEIAGSNVWMFVCCECCVLSGRGLCDGLITRPEESYRLWRVVVCDQESSNEEAKALYGAVKNTTKSVVTPGKQATNNPSEVVDPSTVC